MDYFVFKSATGKGVVLSLGEQGEHVIMIIVYGVKRNVQVLAILQGPIVVCCGCSDGYHLSCCDPKVPDGTRSTEFVCSRCMPPTTRPSCGVGM